MHMQEIDSKGFVSSGQAIQTSQINILVLVTGNAGTLERSQGEPRQTVAREAPEGAWSSLSPSAPHPQCQSMTILPTAAAESQIRSQPERPLLHA